MQNRTNGIEFVANEWYYPNSERDQLTAHGSVSLSESSNTAVIYIFIRERY